MASIALRKVPEDVHRQIKRIQLEREEKGERLSLEDLYIELLKEALDARKKS